jgi:hypothetical protein
VNPENGPNAAFVIASVIIALGFFGLLGFVVRSAPPARVAVVITAIATATAAVPAVIYALAT